MFPMLFALALLHAPSAIVRSDDAAKPDPARATVTAIVNWIGRQGIASKDVEDAILFPGSTAAGAVPQPQIYGGTAGVLIFLENAAAVLHDQRARSLADAAAKGLLAARKATPTGVSTWMPVPRQGYASLYAGDAGIGDAFLIRAQLRDDPAALALATQVGDSLLARGKHEGDQLFWDAQVDIIYGSAGTVLFLLELGTETKEQRFIDGALAGARWLIAQAKTRASPRDPNHTLTFWAAPMMGTATFVNFSHGASGIAYALARVAGVTGDEACAKVAASAADWVMEQAIAHGDDVCWPMMAGTKTALGGWCHGPPGTARLFLLLHDQKDEPRYLDMALASARWLMAQAPAENGDGTPPTPAFPPSFCCGVSGVIDFFCDLYRATGAREYQDFARRAGDYLIQTGIADGNGVKWGKGKNAHDNRDADFGVDLMLGAAGEGLALLRLMTIDQEHDPMRHLPDRAVGGR